MHGGIVAYLWNEMTTVILDFTATAAAVASPDIETRLRAIRTLLEEGARPSRDAFIRRRYSLSFMYPRVGVRAFETFPTR